MWLRCSAWIIVALSASSVIAAEVNAKDSTFFIAPEPPLRKVGAVDAEGVGVRRGRASFSRSFDAGSVVEDIYFGDKGTAKRSLHQSRRGQNAEKVNTRRSKPSTDPNPQQPQNPVIALVANPMSDCPDEKEHPELAPPHGFKPTGCYTDFYLKWLQPHGIRVVPMSAFWPSEKKKALMDKVNGVMLLGGGLDGDDRKHYTRNVSYIFDYALERPGFLLWGTCQGMQVMSILLHQKNFDILTCDYVGTEPSMLPLEMTPYQPKSVLFGLEAQRMGIVSDLIEHKTTLNWHHCGIDPKVFENKTRLDKIVEAPIIANNVDVNGKPFVSAFEIVDGGRNMFAVQYHPERPALWFAHDVIGHDRQSIDVANYHARFIADRLKLNSHSFANQSEVSRMVLDAYPHRYASWGAGWIWVDI